jgi:hypothetical protein
MRGLYSREDARSFLLGKDGRLLSDDDPALPRACRRLESWILPIGWKNCPEIIVCMPHQYPDALPKIFWPANIPRREIKAHINSEGNICAMEDNTTVNPMKAPEVLDQALRQAQEIVEASLSDAELLSQIEPEFSAYWTGNGPPIHFLPAHLAADYFLLRASKNRWETEAADTGHVFKDHIGFGINVQIGREDILPLLRDRRAFLTNNAQLRTAIDQAAGYVGERNRGAKSVTLFLALVLPSPKGEVVAFARGLDIRIKKKPRHELTHSIYQGLCSAQPCCHSENLSTLRLLRRSIGYEFGTASDSAKKVAVIGCGSLGGFVADNLTRSDLIDLLLIDPQPYLPQNLARHVLPPSYLYQNKAKALKDYLLGRFCDRRIEAVEADFRSEEAQGILQSFLPDNLSPDPGRLLSHKVSNDF